MLIVALQVSSSVKSKSMKVKLYKLKESADGIGSEVNLRVSSLLAVAW